MKSKCGSTAVQEILSWQRVLFFAFVFGKGGILISSKVSIAIVLAIVAAVLVVSGVLQLKGDM